MLWMASAVKMTKIKKSSKDNNGGGNLKTNHYDHLLLLSGQLG